MVALKILDIKDFTNKLFIGEVFDQFWLNEADIATYNIFSIDGKIQRDFYDNDELELLDKTQRTYSLWKEVRPYCCTVIRGKRTPLYFKIILQLSLPKTAALIRESDIAIHAENVRGLYLNLQYKNKVLLCTTGTSLTTFLPGKHLDQLWDGMVLDFFSQHKILFEEM